MYDIHYTTISDRNFTYKQEFQTVEEADREFARLSKSNKINSVKVYLDGELDIQKNLHQCLVGRYFAVSVKKSKYGNGTQIVFVDLFRDELIVMSRELESRYDIRTLAGKKGAAWEMYDKYFNEAV